MLLKPKLDSILEIFSCVCMPPSELTCLKATLIPPCCVSYFDCRLCFRCRQACEWRLVWCSGGSVIAPLPGLGQTALVINQYSRDSTEGFVTEPPSLECKQRTFCKASTYLAARFIPPPPLPSIPQGGGRTHSPDHMWPLCLLQSLSANSIPLSGVHRPGSLRPVGSFTHPRSMWHIEPFFPFPNPPLSLSVSSLLRTDKASVIKPWFFTVHFPSVSLLIVFRASTWPGTISNAA